MKRPIPVTSCTECGNAGYNRTLIDLRCGETVNGNAAKARIRAQLTIPTGKNAHPATELEPNETQLAPDVGERGGFLSEW